MGRRGGWAETEAGGGTPKINTWQSLRSVSKNISGVHSIGFRRCICLMLKAAQNVSQILVQYTGWFLTVPFSAEMKRLAQPTRSFLTLKIS